MIKMFGFIKKMLLALLSSIVNVSTRTKRISLSNQKCKIQPTLINLHSNKFNQELQYDTFPVKLDRCGGSYNTLNDLSNKGSVSNKADELNLSVFNLITGINESEILTKHTSCGCKNKFDKRKCSSDQKWNNDKY